MKNKQTTSTEDRRMTEQAARNVNRLRVWRDRVEISQRVGRFINIKRINGDYALDCGYRGEKS